MPDETPVPQSPGKLRRCKQCLQPRKGHPRSGCPGVAQNTPEEPHAPAIIASGSRPPEHGVAEASSHRHRRPSPKSPQQPDSPHQTVQTVPYPAADSSDLFSALRLPGLLDERKDPLDERIERWRQDVTQSIPGDATVPSSPQSRLDELGWPTPRQREKKPLTRTMSAEERVQYLEDLRQSTKHTAQVFIMEPEDIPRALEGAQKQGFFGGAHTPSEGGDAFLVIGMDKIAVEKLLEQIRTGQSSPTRTGAAGALVGAVAMWAGLAWS